MQKVSLLKLYLIFVKIGAILLGGGYVILPIMISEFSEKRNLVSKNEIIDYFAISQSLPGIIAANISMFVGYKVRGKEGSILGMLGVITVPFFTIVALASILGLLVNNIYVQNILWGVGVAVIALILLTIREVIQNSKKDLFFYFILALALLALLFFNWSPIKTILIIAPLGVFYKFLTTPKEAR